MKKMKLNICLVGLMCSINILYAGQTVTLTNIVQVMKSLQEVTPPAMKAIIPPPVQPVPAKTVAMASTGAIKPAIATSSGSVALYNLSFNATNLAQSDILWTSANGFTKGGQFTTSALNLTNLYSQNGTSSFTCPTGLVRMNVGVTDGSGVWLAFNFNAQLFNTLAMQRLIQKGMYISVLKTMQGSVPTITVQLTDSTGLVYAQGSAPACMNPSSPTTNFNPIGFTVGINTYTTENADGKVKIAIGSAAAPINIGQTVLYQQASMTPANSYLTLPWTNNENFAPGYTGNTNIANITPYSVTSIGSFAAGSANFSSSVTEISSANLFSTTATTLSQALVYMDIELQDTQANAYNWEMTAVEIPQLGTLAILGMFVVVDLIPSGKTGGPSANIYLCDVNGTIYAQNVVSIAPNADLASYSVKFNTTAASGNGTNATVVSNIPLNKVLWYQSTLTSATLASNLAGSADSTNWNYGFTATPFGAYQVSMNNGQIPVYNSQVSSCLYGLEYVMVYLTDALAQQYLQYVFTAETINNILPLLQKSGSDLYVSVATGWYTTVSLTDKNLKTLASAQIQTTRTAGLKYMNVGFNVLNPVATTPLGANQTYVNWVPVSNQQAVVYAQANSTTPAQGGITVPAN